ncbi:MAG TPA: hypothetical protein VFZ98_07285 [Vicinamibacterales bacterium]
MEVAPWFAAIGHYKQWLFGGSAALLALNYWLVVVRPRRCAPGELCHTDTPFMRFNRRVYWVSLIVFLVAGGVTYGGLLVATWMES